MIALCDSTRCVACGACAQICPQDAIRLQEDSSGFFSPQIDPGKCVSCGACRKSCPVLNPQDTHDILACYAGWTANRQERRGSSSGGIAYAISKKTIHDGGVVFACRYTPDGDVEQTCIETLDELESARGSKYVKSATKDTYRRTKTFLDKGRKVLWIGTPCQIAGLYGYLGKGYGNLLTVDLICHGTPPARYWKEYLVHLFPNQRGITCSFRDNTNGYCMFVRSREKLLRKCDWKSDPYFHAFMYGLDLNESCYSCPFASGRRVADLTLGDFWGLDRKDLEKVPFFPSMILVNTQSGRKILDVLQNELVLIERDVSEAVAGNAQLRQPTPRHALREKFVNSYHQKGFYAALKETGITGICRKNLLKYRLKQPLCFFYKKLWKSSKDF